MRVMNISYSTKEYLWFPASIRIDGEDFHPDNPDIRFAFVAPKTTPQDSDYGISGNLDYGVKNKPNINFLFDGPSVGLGRYDLWILCSVLGEDVRRKVAEIHII